MTDVYYKVVRKNRRGSLVSAVATGAAEIRYEPYGWTTSRRSLRSIDQDICVFREYEDAREFACTIFDDGKCLQIWACECEGLHFPTVFVRTEVFDYYRTMADVIDFIRKRRNERPLAWPDGTMMAKRIHLKGLITEYK